MTTLQANARRHRQRLLGRFARCPRGVAAVEFGYIAPLMLLMLLGALEFSRAITIDRRVTQVASSTADLIARQTTVTTTDLNGFMQIIAQLLAPYDSDILKLTASQVYIPAGGTAADTKICWSYNRSVTISGNPTDKGVATYTNNQAYSTLPTGLIAAGESVIMVEVEYDYSPFVKNLLGVSWASWNYMQSVATLKETFYLKPRLSTSIEKDGLNC